MVTKSTLRRVAVIAAVASVVALAPSLGASAQEQPAVPSVGRHGTLLSPRLADLSAQATATTSAGAEARIAGLPAEGEGALLRDESGRLLIDVRVAAVDPALEAAIARAGGEVTATAPDEGLITVAIDAASLEALAAVPGVLGAYELQVPVVHGGANLGGLRAALQEVGPVTNAVCGDRIVSEADTQLAAASARSTYAVDGTGIVVGVLSDSYNNLGGAATDVANGELPGPGNPCGRTTAVQLQSDLTSGGSDEGRAMAQAVHDLAPGATIRVATAFRGDIDFANQIRALAAAGAKVIVDDITYFNEPMYQDGIIAKAVNDVVAQGVVYFSSAQNSNLRIGSNDVGSYEAAAFRPMSCPSAFTGSGTTSCHDFNPSSGTDSGNGFTVAAGGQLRFVLGYSQPAYGVTTDLDLYVLDSTTGGIVASSTNDNVGVTDLTFESLDYVNTTGSSRVFNVVVGRFDSTGTPRFRVISSRSSGVTATERTATSGTDVIGPTSYGHNMTPKAGSIAAIPYNSNTAPESFSSRGPVTYCWGPVVGTTPAALLGSCATDTIDITATDGAANSFFGSLSAGTYRFYGTSQAAPHAAAIAALQKQYRPCRTPAQILAAQRSAGVAIGSFGQNAVGGGRLQAPAAIANLAACPANAAAPFASYSALVDRIYTDMIGVAPTSSQRTGYVNRLNAKTLTPGGLIAELRLSSDHVNNVDPVTRLYRAYFLRIPDKGGLEYWIRQRRVNGKKLNAISDNFAASSEFKTKYGSLSNQAYVELVYQNVLGRAGDASGISYWTGKLNNKTASRGSVMTGFSESSEYKRKQVAEVDVSVLYILNLKRSPTTGEFNALVSDLEVTAIKSVADVGGDLVASGEYDALIP